MSDTIQKAFVRKSEILGTFESFLLLSFVVGDFVERVVMIIYYLVQDVSEIHEQECLLIYKQAYNLTQRFIPVKNNKLSKIKAKNREIKITLLRRWQQSRFDAKC